MAKKAGYFTENPKPKGKIIRALTPQIVDSAEGVTEAHRDLIPRSEEDHVHLRDTLKVEQTKWGARVFLGDDSRPGAAESFEFGNRTRKNTPIPGHQVLKKIADSLESS